MLRICQLLAIVLCSWPCLTALPDWSVTSWMGGCWGALLLTGLSATWARQRLAWCLYCVLLCAVSHVSMSRLTDFGHQATWLVILTLLGSGWLIGVALIPLSQRGRVPGQPLDQTGRQAERYRFSAWDLFCGTALVAWYCATLPHVENQFDLLCQVAPAFSGGIVLSTLALQWTWKDNWSLSNLLAAGSCLLLATLLIMPWSGMWNSPWAMLSWIIAGPLSVMAAQCAIVLVWSAALRNGTLEAAE